MNDQPQQPNPPDRGGPADGPAASNTPAPYPPIDAESTGLPSAKCSALQGTTAPATRPVPRRIPNAIVDRIDRQLSDRDRAILRSVDQHQFLSARQIEILHFDTIAPTARSRITRRVLSRLRGLRLLSTLDRQIGGTAAGSDALIHHLDVTGARILTAEDSGRRDRRLRYPPTARFVRHRLAVADTHIGFIAAHRSQLIELVDSAIEPACWRTFTGNGSTHRTLKPDLYAETATEDELVHAWFIEIDLGTESIPTLLRKCSEYEAYRQSGIEQDRHGSFPLVVWSITHRDPAKAARRRHDLVSAIEKDRRLPSALFRIVAPDQLLALIQHGGRL